MPIIYEHVNEDSWYVKRSRLEPGLEDEPLEGAFATYQVVYPQATTELQAAGLLRDRAVIPIDVFWTLRRRYLLHTRAEGSPREYYTRCLECCIALADKAGPPFDLTPFQEADGSLIAREKFRRRLASVQEDVVKIDGLFDMASRFKRLSNS